MWLRECVCMPCMYCIWVLLPSKGAVERAKGGAASWRAHMAMMKLPPSSYRFLRSCARTGEGARALDLQPACWREGPWRWCCSGLPGGGGPSTIPPRWNVCRAGGGLNGGDFPTPPSRPWGRLFQIPHHGPPLAAKVCGTGCQWVLLSHARHLVMHAYMHACAHACMQAGMRVRA